MFQMTETKLELSSDIDMYLFVDKRMGVTSYNAKRYSKVNNKYMKSYDDSKPSKYIIYLNEKKNVCIWIKKKLILM